MDVAEVVGYASVMRRKCRVAVPDACAGEMACAFFQRGVARSLVDLHRQSDFRNGDRTQAVIGIIQAVGDCRIAGGCIGLRSGLHDRGNGNALTAGAGLHGGRNRLHSCRSLSGDKVGRQQLAAAGKIGSGTAKGRRNVRRVFAAVNVGGVARTDINGVLRSRLGKQAGLRRLNGVLCRIRRYSHQRKGKAQHKKHCQLSFHHLYPRFLSR